MTDIVEDEISVSENRNNTASSIVDQGVPEDQGDGNVQEEKPSSLNAVDHDMQTEGTSSLGNYPNNETPEFEPDIEGSLAYSSQRRDSIKRYKRFLPADEQNVVSERFSLDDYLASETPPLAAYLRNAIVTAVVTEVERERQITKDSATPDSAGMVDFFSTSSSEPQISPGNLHETFNHELIDDETWLKKKKIGLDGDKSARSETYLLNGSTKHTHTIYENNRSRSAPIEPAIEFTTRYTQTEWSWLKDIETLKHLKSELKFSMKINSSDEDTQSAQSSKYVSPEVHKSDKDQTEESSEPEDELFKEPTMELSSESSSDDEQDIIVNKKKGLILPSVGPPKILQYIKESTNPQVINYTPKNDDLEKSDTVNLHEHSTGTVTIVPPSSSGHLVNVTETETVENDERELQQAQVMSHEETKVEIVDAVQQASVESQELSSLSFEDFIREQSIYKEDEEYIKDEIIDIKPHPPFGTKAARKAAKERAAERAREREIERQKVSGNTVNFYAMTRQMKTLAYSLASTKCMDDGWTVKKPDAESGSEIEEGFEPFEIRVNPSMTQLKETFFEKFYNDGKHFLVLFPDGTGTCYYPSGNPAVIISSTEKGKYSYILQEDIQEHSRDHTGILGVFNPTGHGCCYYEASNTLRMVLTPFGGTYFDNKGIKKKKWLWYNNHGNHVHAPPFQPITFALSKVLSVRCMGQDSIIITYNHGRHTIRFNVGARLKAAKKIRPLSHVGDYELHLKEVKQFVNLVIDKIRSTLRFPHCTRINKLPLEKPERHDRSRSKRRERKLLDTDDTTTVVVN